MINDHMLEKFNIHCQQAAGYDFEQGVMRKQWRV
jgi:hypothetical protein